MLTAKPVLFVANVAESQLGKEATNPHLLAAQKLAEAEGAGLVVICAGLEAEIQQLPPRSAPDSWRAQA